MSEVFSLVTEVPPLQLGRSEHEMILDAMVPGANRALGLFLTALRFKLSQPGSGRLYDSKRGSGKHRASKPGEPPAPDRGDWGGYRSSWSGQVRREFGSITLSFSSTMWLIFGRRLELGGWGGGVYIAPRPHVSPTMDDTLPAMYKLLENG